MRSLLLSILFRVAYSCCLLGWVWPHVVADHALLALGLEKIQLGGPIAPDGKTEVQVDLPVTQRIKNIGSKLDGAGMCVYSSCEMSMRWANVESYRGWRDWCADHYRGGGWPSKVDDLIAAYAKAKNVAPPTYLQYEGKDTSVLKSALSSGRMPAITYSGRDGVHYRSSIAHMTNLVYLDETWACVLDNNFTGENELVWMTPQEFYSRWAGNGNGWSVVFLAPPPPPPPKN